MMSDQSYIRKAIELADGFQLTNDDRYFSLPHGGYVPVIAGCQQQYIDAIAAQLVRQYLRIIASQSNLDGYPVFETDGDSINTIRAIVDSEVLAIIPPEDNK